MSKGFLSGRHAVVTGAGSGIGRAIAIAFAAEGAAVSLFGRRVETLEATRGALAGDALAVAVDVTDEAAVRAGFAAARKRFGPVAILVNNAGMAESAPLHRTSLETWQKTLDVNLTGSFLCMREALEDLRAGDYGRIINIASTAGRKGFAYVGAYCASKHGLIGLTRSLAAELAGTATTVNAICPGYVETDMTRRSLGNIVATTGRTAEEALDSLVAGNPQGRLVQPEEIAAAALWLAGMRAGGVTGQALMIDGGEVT